MAKFINVSERHSLNINFIVEFQKLQYGGITIKWRSGAKTYESVTVYGLRAADIWHTLRWSGQPLVDSDMNFLRTDEKDTESLVDVDIHGTMMTLTQKMRNGEYFRVDAIVDGQDFTGNGWTAEEAVQSLKNRLGAERLKELL